MCNDLRMGTFIRVAQYARTEHQLRPLGATSFADGLLWYHLYTHHLSTAVAERLRTLIATFTSQNVRTYFKVELWVRVEDGQLYTRQPDFEHRMVESTHCLGPLTLTGGKANLEDGKWYTCPGGGLKLSIQRSKGKK